MPRETIQADPGATTEVVVTWTPSQHLQVGIEDVQGHHLIDRMLGRTNEHDRTQNGESATLSRVAKAVEAVVLAYQSSTQGSYDELGELICDAITGNSKGFTGLWVESLDRPATQKLVRVLKRARNAVFGADE
jgi:hypothetical protein